MVSVFTMPLLHLHLIMVFFAPAAAIYFSMTDVVVNLPVSRELQEKHRILSHLYIHETESRKPLKYYLIKNEDGYFRINGTLECIFLTNAFFKANINGLKNINFEVSTGEHPFEINSAKFQLHVTSSNALNCNAIIEDLCFWHSVTYILRENKKSCLIGSLSTSYLMELCETFSVNYTITRGQDKIELVEPRHPRETWYIRSKKPFDRELGKYNFTVACLAESNDGVKKEVHKDLFLDILDQNDNSPTPQLKELDIYLANSKVKKGQMVEHQELIFNDLDSPPVNNYIITVEDDYLNILEPKCAKHINDRYGRLQTAISCKLMFTNEMDLNVSVYSVVLVIKDSSLHEELIKQVARLPIHIHTSENTKPIDKVYAHPLLLYPRRNVAIFRTAAQYARVTQPRDDVHISDMQKFTVTIFGAPADIFNITTEGIIYVQSTTHLRKLDVRISQIFRAQIMWQNNKTKEFDEIFIHIIDEPTASCVNVTVWNSCSENSKRKKCEETCGISTGGSPAVQERKYGNSGRCMWRGERKPGTNLTPIYSTCTPDIETCSDGICDSLELLNSYICPQDCTKEVNFPTKRNGKTGRGIEADVGICTCDKFPRCSCTPPRQNLTKMLTFTVAPNVKDYANFVSTYPNISKKQTGPKLITCGATCIMSTSAAGVFLIGTAVIAIICWKLGAVQRVINRKFSENPPEASAPLSEYVDRITATDDFQLTLDVTRISNKHTLDPKWEFPRNRLIIEQTLGEGEFGRVLRAKAQNIDGFPGYSTVAVKTLKDDARDAELADLLSEYEVLKDISHPNIIRFLGASTTPDGPVYLIIEYAQYGSLRNYIRRSRFLCINSNNSFSYEYNEEETSTIVTPRDILSFAWQICNGMAYLTDIKLVHRDLAARNVLVASDKNCKISDFGLTRDIYEDDAYLKRSKGRVPVKWMAPESLADHIYTSKSDVWSFGILVWELVTLGATPYPGIEVQNLFHLLRTGYRMECPENCSPRLYDVMKSCWKIKPEDRPNFRDLALQWEKMLNDQVDYLDLSGNAVNNRSYFSASNRKLKVFPASSPLCHKTNDETASSNIVSTTLNARKCGEFQKDLQPLGVNLNRNNEEEYEVPVHMNARAQTPHNGFPECYTNIYNANYNNNINM